MPVHIVDLLDNAMQEAGVQLKGTTVCVLGYAFLENSDDAKNTPTFSLIKELERRGVKYKIHDPYIKADQDLKIGQDLNQALQDCDAVVLMTKHDEYKNISPVSLGGILRNKIVIDGRNMFDPGDFVANGFVFKGVGKGNVGNRRGL